MKPDLTFPANWSVEVLTARPLISPARQFVYPKQAEEVERGALELLVRPATGGVFLATCALGFADQAAPTGVWACPHPDWMCAVAGGYAYLIDTLTPESFQQLAYRPVLEVRALPENELLLFKSHHSLLAWGRDGIAWRTPQLSWEGVEIVSIHGNVLHGKGWDLMTDQDVDFSVNLQTGQTL